VKTHGVAELTVRLAGAAYPVALPDEGTVLEVAITGQSADGRFRIRVGSIALLASAPDGSWRPGDTFLATIRYRNGTLFLVPNPVQPRVSDVLPSLGLPQHPVSTFLVQFFKAMNRRLDGSILRSLARQALSHTDRPLRAAEALALLESASLIPSEEAVEALSDIIEGKGYETEAKALAYKRLTSLINHCHAHSHRWMCIPFDKEIEGKRLHGSIRVLYDEENLRVVQTLVTVDDESRLWDFSLDSQSCLFSVYPPPDPVVFGRLRVYLEEELRMAGISKVVYHDGIPDSTPIPSVDLEA